MRWGGSPETNVCKEGMMSQGEFFKCFRRGAPPGQAKVPPLLKHKHNTGFPYGGLK